MAQKNDVDGFWGGRISLPRVWGHGMGDVGQARRWRMSKEERRIKLNETHEPFTKVKTLLTASTIAAKISARVKWQLLLFS